VLEDVYPVRWAGQQAVVTLPEHIDVSNAGQIREELLSVINRGATALVADMTATISCDHAGADAVARAYRRAVISGTELRLVVSAPIVVRMLSLGGLDRLVSIYPSLEAAAAARTPAARPAPAASTAEVAASDPAAPRRPGPEGAQLPAAGPPDGNTAGISPAVVRELLDALQNAVALADGDGTTVTVEISLSPVATAAGPSARTMIRDVTAAQRIAGREHPSRELLDRVITSLFHVGLSLQATTGLPVEVTRQRIADALGHLDDTIREIRDSAFTARDHRTSLSSAPSTDGHRRNPSSLTP
jgi:anti-sigma B factor antagonist